MFLPLLLQTDCRFSGFNLWALYSVPLIHMSAFVPVPYCFNYCSFVLGFPGGSGKEFACQCKKHGFDPWVGKIAWRRKWQPTSVFFSWKIPWTEEPQLNNNKLCCIAFSYVLFPQVCFGNSGPSVIPIGLFVLVLWKMS